MPWVLNLTEFWTWQSPVKAYSDVSRTLCNAHIFEHYTAFWICQNMPWQSFEYILGFKNAWILIWQGSEYARVTQDSNYVTTWLNVWTGREYAWITEFSIIDRVQKIYHTIHSARSLYKLMSTYWEIQSLFRTGSKIKMERFGKIIIVFNCFRK